MEKNRKYRSEDELPLTLNASDIADVLGISRSMAYQILHSGCPVARFGKRMVVSKERFLAWLDEETKG